MTFLIPVPIITLSLRRSWDLLLQRSAAPEEVLQGTDMCGRLLSLLSQLLTSGRHSVRERQFVNGGL